MKNVRDFILVAAILCGLGSLFAQTDSFGKGAVLDAAVYDRVPEKATQLTRAYTAVPRAMSLKAYAPTPGNQGPYGTCTAWSTAYAARTVAESIALHRTNRVLTTNNVFSPAFVYKNISNDPECQTGTSVVAALELLKTIGAVKMQSTEKTVPFVNVSLAWFSQMPRYRIADYVRLTKRDKTSGGSDVMVRATKKSLAEEKPVIIAMNCPPSFNKAADVWRPTEDPKVDYGAHAMCVIGYDDDFNNGTGYSNGAFEIQNSWSTQWGDGGYIKIPYEVYAAFTVETYEVIDDLTSYGATTTYAGSVQIEVSDGTAMPVAFSDGFYRTTGAWRSGTRFRYLMGNDAPAYVYAFAADESGAAPNAIFPLGNISPVLDYSKNTVPFPPENGNIPEWIALDTVAGTDYLVVLYSKHALNIDAIMSRFHAAQGAFPARVAAAVGDNFIPASQAKYETGEIRFTATTRNSDAVFGLLLAITHR
jgi:C1A family cysteine protease